MGKDIQAGIGALHSTSLGNLLFLFFYSASIFSLFSFLPLSSCYFDQRMMKNTNDASM